MNFERQSLFFFRRRPRWGIPREWFTPPTDASYQAIITAAGMLSEPEAERLGLASSLSVQEDLHTLNEEVVPERFRCHQRAQYYQNQLFLNQWIAIIASFLIGVMLALVVLFVPEEASGDLTFAKIFGVITVIVIQVSAFTATRSNQMDYQRRWHENRLKAETLLQYYFYYLFRLAPFDTVERKDKLRRAIINIGEGIDYGWIDPASETLTPRPEVPHPADALRRLTLWYTQNRLQNMLKFYPARIEEFKANLRFTKPATLLMIVLLALSVSLLISVNVALLANPVVAIFLAIIPGFAGLLSSFEQLYSWDKTSAAYQEAYQELRVVQSNLPYSMENEPDMAQLAAYVVYSTEAVIASEIAHSFGAPVARVATGSLESKVDQAVMTLALNPEQARAFRSVVRDILARS